MMEHNILNVSTDQNNNATSPSAESESKPTDEVKMSSALISASHRDYCSSQAISPLPLHLNHEPANQFTIAGTMEQICIHDASLSPKQLCTNQDKRSTKDTLDRTSEHSPSDTHTNDGDFMDDSMQSSSDTSQPLNNCKKSRRELPPQTVALLKGWMLSPEHIKHPYPTDADKQILLKETGLNMKQLTNWFTNARKRIWKPMMRQQQTKNMRDHAQFDMSFGLGSINLHRRDTSGRFCADKLYAIDPKAPFTSSNSMQQTFQPEVDQMRRHSLNRGYCPPRNIRSMSESATGNSWAAFEYQQQCLRKRSYAQMDEQDTIERGKHNYHLQLLPGRAAKALSDWVQSKLHSSSPFPSSLYPTDAEILNFARQFDVSPASIEQWFDVRVTTGPCYEQPRRAREESSCLRVAAHHASASNLTFSRNKNHRFLNNNISSIPSPNNPMFPSTSVTPFASSIPSKKNPLFPPPPAADRCNSIKSAFPFDTTQHTFGFPRKLHAGFNRAHSSKLPALHSSTSGQVSQSRDARSHTLDMAEFADACRRKMNFQDVLESSTARLEIGAHTHPATFKQSLVLRQFTASLQQPAIMRPTSDDDVAQLLLYDQQDRRTWRNNFRDVGRRPSRILNAVFVLGIFAFLALLFHIYSVSLLRDVKVTLLDLIVPDMCHADTNAQMKVQLMNPSYCSPMIRSISYTIIAQGLGTVIGSIQIPSFKLSSDKSIKLLDLQIHIHLSPFELFETIKKYKHNLRILESYTVEIGCFLIPLKKTIQLSRDIAAENALFFLHPNESWNGTMEQLLLRILKTISLSHFRVEDDMIHERVFAFTTVKFGYQSRIKWNVPSFALWLENAQYGSILQVGMKRFILGTVNTHISAFTVLQHNETKSLLQMLKSYLASNQDMTMSVRGSERHNDCYFSQLLQYIQIDFIIPSQVDGKPVFLRKYAVQPYLKQLNSKTRVCLLQLNVSIIVNNPLPITFQLLRTEFDLYYKVYKGKTERFLNEKSSLPISSKETFHPFPNRHESPYTVFLAHIDETYSITWAAHEEHQVLLQVNIQKFIICTKLFQLYLQNQLFFTVWKGVLGLRIAGGNLSIPFQFNDIHVTPHFK